MIPVTLSEIRCKNCLLFNNNNNNNNNNIYALIERISMLNALYVNKKKKENKKAL